MNNPEQAEKLADELAKTILGKFFNKEKTEKEIFETVIDRFRQEIYKDFPNADPKIVEFYLELNRDLIDEIVKNNCSTYEIQKLFTSASKKTFKKFFESKN